ncbi:DUF4870 domain-containing protein [Alkalibacillus aidingensis]|uniref:DUF4870 domain-containing protein n=1 Tax=Alkalibacillus aidingensis TaxID=2747607 RepID=UPI0016600761|nr:DUF4870 domain-containing protein [Alkalibacillus aidingensis]
MLAIIGYAIPLFLPMPLFNIVITYIYWRVLPSESDFTDHHLKENINYQISIQLYMLSFFVLVFIVQIIGQVGFIPDIASMIGILLSFGVLGLMILAAFTWVILLAVAVIAVLMGKYFRFPLIIRFVK